METMNVEGFPLFIPDAWQHADRIQCKWFQSELGQISSSSGKASLKKKKKPRRLGLSHVGQPLVPFLRIFLFFT